MLQESLSQFIQFVLWFSLIEASLAAIDLAKRRAALRGSEPPGSTPGFEMIKRAVR